MDYPASTENRDTHVCLFMGACIQGMLSSEKKKERKKALEVHTPKCLTMVISRCQDCE